eukprot:2922355-Alexandrium_andersonii.AAC.1
MGLRTPAPSEPRAGLPPRVQATAHVVRPHTAAHLLAELIPVAPAGLAEKPLERGPAIAAHEML